MPSGRFRTLTAGEALMARAAFGEYLDPSRVRLFSIPVWKRAFVASGRLIVWPSVTARVDFSTAPLGVRAVFLHELTHVWQAQNGVNLIWAKLRAGDGEQAYAYEISESADFRDLNIEQQAMVVQDAYLAANGCVMPYETTAYSRILATWSGPKRENPRKV